MSAARIGTGSPDRAHAHAACEGPGHEPAYAALALVRADLLGGWASQAHAIELLTGDGYLLALAQDEAARKSADDYLAGTLDGLIVINEVTASDEGRMFCLSTERAGRPGQRAPAPGVHRLAARCAVHPRCRSEDPDGLPLAILGWAFLERQVPLRRSGRQPGTATMFVRACSIRCRK